MARYRLTAGQHVAADRSKPLLGPDGKPNGRFASRTYRAGDEFDSDRDLAAAEPQRYQRVGGDGDRVAELEGQMADLQRQLAEARGTRTPGEPSPENLAENPAVAPGGQVSTGFQQAQPGRPGSSAAPPEKARELLEAQGQEAGQAKAPQPPAAPPEEDLDAMTVPELRDYAADHEVDLRGARTKDEIIRAVRQAKR